MKIVIAVVALLAACSHALGNANCNVPAAIIPTEWITIQSNCERSMRTQIQMEVDASIKYLVLGAHFSRDKVNRPGFAKFFFDAASEEREHAMKLIDYLLMRGSLTSDVTNLIKVEVPRFRISERLEYVGKMDDSVDGVAALEQALKLETNVTKSIREVIINCETDATFNDYHLVDYLTGEFLEEQYKGQRDLAGKLTTLKKMAKEHEALGEFLFDKKLLGMDI